MRVGVGASQCPVVAHAGPNLWPQNTFTGTGVLIASPTDFMQGAAYEFDIAPTFAASDLVVGDVRTIIGHSNTGFVIVYRDNNGVQILAHDGNPVHAMPRSVYLDFVANQQFLVQVDLPHGRVYANRLSGSLAEQGSFVSGAFNLGSAWASLTTNPYLGYVSNLRVLTPNYALVALGTINQAGDSITAGLTSPSTVDPGGSRWRLQLLLSENRTSYTAVGTSNYNPASSQTQVLHSAYSGETLVQMLARIEDPSFTVPNVYTVLGGTNDLSQGASVSQVVSRTIACVEAAIAKGANYAFAGTMTRIANNTAYNTFVAQIWEQLHAHAWPSHTGIVSVGEYVTDSMLLEGDGTHPGETGHQEIATRWFAGLDAAGLV